MINSNYIRFSSNKTITINSSKLYSISFITRMLRDGDFKKVTGEVIKDDDINECRKIYFT